MKVKQEIEKHRQIELFDRKQNVYRALLNQMSKIVDYGSTTLGKSANWRISRSIYNELLISGSTSVIDAFNQFAKNYDTSTDQVGTELIKKVWIAVRDDLYDETLTSQQIKFFSPDSLTLQAFEIINKNFEKLLPLKLDNYESLSIMDVDDIHTKTGINKDELQHVKDRAIRELSILKEWENFDKEKSK